MTRPIVFFSHSTALRIVRALGSEKPEGEARKRRLSERFPKAGELQQALGSVVSLCPGLSFDSEEVHVTIGGSALPCTHVGRFRLHACSMLLPGGSLIRVAEGVYVASPNLAIMQIAASSREDSMHLTKLIWEACGTYRTNCTGSGTAYDVPALTSVASLRAYVQRCGPLHGVGKVRRAMRFVADGSASPRETVLALVLGMPRKDGGYGLGIPRMNYEVVANGSVRQSSGRSGFRCDLCWPESKLDVEYQSKERHEGEISRHRDSRRANGLASLGWTVVHVTNNELDSLYAMDTVAQALYRALGRRWRVRVDNYYARRVRLRMRTGLPVGREWEGVPSDAWRDRAGTTPERSRTTWD